jgi:hypothetical protein
MSSNPVAQKIVEDFPELGAEFAQWYDFRHLSRDDRVTLGRIVKTHLKCVNDILKKVLNEKNAVLLRLTRELGVSLNDIRCFISKKDRKDHRGLIKTIMYDVVRLLKGASLADSSAGYAYLRRRYRTSSELLVRSADTCSRLMLSVSDLEAVMISMFNLISLIAQTVLRQDDWASLNSVWECVDLGTSHLIRAPSPKIRSLLQNFQNLYSEKTGLVPPPPLSPTLVVPMHMTDDEDMCVTNAALALLGLRRQVMEIRDRDRSIEKNADIDQKNKTFKRRNHLSITVDAKSGVAKTRGGVSLRGSRAALRQYFPDLTSRT